MPLEDRVKWNKHLAKKIDPVQFYREHYPGLTRGQLSIKAPGLYRRLWKDGLLEQVPKKS